jgi:hypothetical protein
MSHLHYDLGVISNHNVVRVSLSEWANVLLLDDANYGRYKNGQQYNYYGGLVEQSPYNIRPPHRAHWNLVVDKGGYAGTVRASVKIT